MNNIIKIYATTSGSNALVETGFRIYKGSYKTIDVEFYIPKDLISIEEGISTAVSMGGLLVSEDGKNITTQNYYCSYKRDETKNGVEYAVYGRPMPSKITSQVGTQKIVFNVIALNSEVPDDATIESIVTTQTVNILVEASAYIEGDDDLDPSQVAEIWAELGLKQNIHDTNLETTAKDVVPAINELNTNKQNKQDNALQTTSKNIVGAINEVDAHADTNTTNIAENAEAISGLDTRLTAVEQQIAGGETYIGTMTGTTLPTDDELDGFVYDEKGRDTKNGDMIYFVLQVTGGTDKIYHYKYSDTQGWVGVEMPAIESAGNGEKGLVQGTYGVGSTNNTLVNIVGGEIKDIYVKDNSSEYRNIREYTNTTATQLANILNGTTVVPKATNATNATNAVYSTNATNDGSGNNIVNTYLTKTEGASKSYVKQYALPREFNDLYYITDDGYSKDLPTDVDPIYSVSFSGDVEKQIFVIEKTDQATYQLSNKNSATTVIYVEDERANQMRFTLTTGIQIGDDDPITLSVEEANVIEMVAGEIYKITFDDNFHNLTDDIEITDGATIIQTLKGRKIDTGASSPIINIYSNEAYPSTFALNTTGYDIKTGAGKVGEMPVYVLKDYTKFTSSMFFTMPDDYNGNTNAQFELWILKTDLANNYTIYGEDGIAFKTPSGNATPEFLNNVFQRTQTITFEGTYVIFTFTGFINANKTTVYINTDAIEVNYIKTTNDTTVNGCSMPALTRNDISNIVLMYDKNRAVVIKDSTGVNNYEVISVTKDSNNIAYVEVAYKDIMLVTYSAEDSYLAYEVTITYKTLGGGKEQITLTGERGVLTDKQIAKVLNDAMNIEFVLGGRIFKYAENAGNYRTYTNVVYPTIETQEIKALYINTSPDAVNYKSWSVEDITISGGGGGVPIRRLVSYDPVFANNSWGLIKHACQNGKIPATWLVGDTKTFTGTDGNTYTIRLSDKQSGRYTYSSDNTKTTNAVFEVVELVPTSYQWNTSATNAGGFASSAIQTSLNSTIINILPAEIKDLLENIQIKSNTGGTTYTGQSESANKIFLLSSAEVATTSNQQYIDETINNGTTYGRLDYYSTGGGKIKKGVVDETAHLWWLRSPASSSTTNVCDIRTQGSLDNTGASNSTYVSPCWAW